MKTDGKLYVDTQDNECTAFKTGGLYGGSPISSYGRTEANGVAIYGKPGQWSGQIQVLQDPDVTEAILVIDADNTDGSTKSFKMTLTVPSCFD